MNTSLVLTLDKRRIRKDGTYPITLRLSHSNRSTSFSTGISVLEKDWDFEKKQVKKTHTGTTSVTRLNNYLNKQKVKAVDTINRLKEEDRLRFMSITQLKEQITHSEKSHSFIHYGEKLITEMKKSGRIGNATAYKTALNSLKEFHKSQNLYFEELNYEFLVNFENYHKAKGNSYNVSPYFLKGICSVNFNLRNWNSDVRIDIRNLQKEMKYLRKKISQIEEK